MRRCSSVSVAVVAGVMFARFVQSTSLPNGCRAGSIEYCGESDTKGPHCTDCLRTLWQKVGCRPQGERGPDQHRGNVDYWNNHTVLEVEKNMENYKSFAPILPDYKVYCYGTEVKDATDKAEDVSTMTPDPSTPQSSESAVDTDQDLGTVPYRIRTDGGTTIGLMDNISDSLVAGEHSRVTKQKHHEPMYTYRNSEGTTDGSTTTMVKSQGSEAETQETNYGHTHSEKTDIVTSLIPDDLDANSSVTSRVVPPDKDGDWSSFDVDFEDDYDTGGSSPDDEDGSRGRSLPVNGTAEIGRSRVKSDPAATRPYLILGAVLITMTLAGGGGYFIYTQVKNIGAHDITPHKGSAASGSITSQQTSSQPTYKQFRFDEQNV